MKIYLTELTAVTTEDGILRTYAGAKLKAPSFDIAQQYCNIYFPYLKVIGEEMTQSKYDFPVFKPSAN